MKKLIKRLIFILCVVSWSIAFPFTVVGDCVCEWIGAKDTFWATVKRISVEDWSYFHLLIEEMKEDLWT